MLMVDDCSVQDLLCYPQVLKSQIWRSCSASVKYQVNSLPLLYFACSLAAALNGSWSFPEMLCGLIHLQSNEEETWDAVSMQHMLWLERR